MNTKSKADVAPARADNISLRDALLEIGRMAQARKSCIRMPNGMMLDNYIGQVLATKPEQPENIAPAQSGQHTPLESELLEALKRIADEEILSCSCQWPKDIARAAIAKAEGRQQ